MAIIGAGFSGTMLAVHLQEAGASVTLIDRAERTGAGLAYSTAESVHLLNVRAGNMSAYSRDAGHFATWLASRHLGTAATFAQRLTYRDYLADILASAPDGLRRVDDEAVALDGTTVQLASGQRVEADVIVVAAGNLPPEPLASLAGAPVPYVNDPWSTRGRESVKALAAQDGDILIVGTGLTMVDTVLTLEAHGFGGRMTALSRRGLIPRPHVSSAPAAVSSPSDRSPRGLARWMRREAADTDWRLVVDSLRPATASIWQGWTIEQRARFLRHARPWWDVHRHRIAPEVAAQLEDLQARGGLAVHAGRIAGFEGDRVLMRRRGQSTSEALAVAGIVNCTGPQGDLRRSRNSLLRDLLGRGRARVDALGLGLDVDPECRMIDARGDLVQNSYAIGPVTRGAFWEMVAVPDIRVQVQQVSETIMAGHGG